MTRRRQKLPPIPAAAERARFFAPLPPADVTPLRQPSRAAFIDISFYFSADALATYAVRGKGQIADAPNTVDAAFRKPRTPPPRCRCDVAGYAAGYAATLKRLPAAHPCQTLCQSAAADERSGARCVDMPLCAMMPVCAAVDRCCATSEARYVGADAATPALISAKRAACCPRNQRTRVAYGARC